ncbi:Mrp/NBP35 family ATP-binding protein [Aliarcobacter trophiarum]|uniref:Mrp/NBP35 family ATP-binding protein n=1 Tax=Aliarcobacter trophiarum TaxID=708186 RepID=UPI00100A75B0|nr:Mrp/NBP35 family ATP-binding protein [Aliarcobacter trophiarum]RXI26507.1 sodium:proton antiporter [Aliarcobacter trophiarum]
MNIEDIKKALQSVKYPGFSKSIIDFGFVKDIKLEADACTILLDITSTAKEVEDELKKDIPKALPNLNINMIFNKPKVEAQKSNSVSGQNIVPQIKNIVMVSSGKGGVGKSTTTVNLAIASAMQGKKVGVLDADIYGPNIPRMMGVNGQEVEVVGNKAKPLNAYGVDIMSMGVLMKEGEAVIWRGAMIMKAIQQLLRDILWEELDILFIDMPPGTGDAQLTLAQSVPVSAGINVTTPQHVALDDSRRSLDMFQKLHIPIAGIVENMSGFICPSCNTESDIFGTGTCDDLAKEYNTQVLAHLPIEPNIRKGGDSGKPIVYFEPESITAKRYMMAADKLIAMLDSQGEVTNEAIQPIMPAGVSACSTEGQKIKAEHEAKKNSGESCGTGCGCH